MSFKTILGLVIATLVLTAIGCAVNSAPPAGKPQAAAEPPPIRGGAQLWAENCSRCHNLRSPQSYNDAQWAAVVHHMRLRANLEGSEARLITEFLQASH